MELLKLLDNTPNIRLKRIRPKLYKLVTEMVALLSFNKTKEDWQETEVIDSVKAHALRIIKSSILLQVVTTYQV